MRFAVVTRPKPDKRGTLPLYLRVTHGGVKRFVALGLRIPARDWNERKGEVRAGSPHALQVNRIIAERLASAQAAANELPAGGRLVTPDRLKAVVEAALHPEPDVEREPAGVLAYGRGLQAELDAAGKVGTAKVYGTALNHLAGSVAAHFGRADVPMGEVSPPFLRFHRGRLLSPKPRGLGHKPNYAGKQLRTIRAVLRRAAVDEVPGAEAAVRAFAAVKPPSERVQKQRFSRDEVRRIEGAALSGRQADARDVWVFSFYLGGMRVSDVLLLRWAQVDRRGETWRIPWRQKKTGDPNALPLLFGARAVVERWLPRTGPGGPEESPFVFGLLEEADLADPHRLHGALDRRASLIRGQFYKVCDRLGLPHLGPHAARHSLADHLRKEGVPISTISMVLGHSGIQATVHYLRDFDPEGVEEEMRRTLNPNPGSGV